MSRDKLDKIEGGMLVEPLCNADRAELLALVSTCLSSEGATLKSTEFWSWKHERNTFGASVGCVARDATSGRLIAIRPLMKWSFRSAKSQVHDAVRPVDTVTHPQWRGKGIFSKLTRAALGDLPDGASTLVFNTPNQNSLPGYEKMGWVRASKLEILMRPGRISCLVCALWRSIQKKKGACGWQELSRQRVISSRSLSQEDAESILTFCVDAEEMRVPLGLRTCKTQRYLKWRYFEQPNADYGVLVDRASSGKIRSVAFLRCEQRIGFNVVLILDLFVGLDAQANLNTFLKSLTNFVHADFFALHATPSSGEYVAARRNLFLPVKKKILAARYVDAMSALYDVPTGEKYWDLSLADIEIF
jgi:GNAT superfamily N-acetyltransferase